MDLHVGDWISQAREVSIEQAGSLLGIKPGRSGSMGPCISCGAEKRGGHDNRGPIGVNASKTGWKCHSCGATGDVVDMVAYATAGSRLAECSKEQQRAVVQWFKVGGHVKDGGMPTRTKTKKTQPEKKRPPQAEVQKFWLSTKKVTGCSAVSSFLADRKFSPDDVAALGFIRATAAYPDCGCPDWWPKVWTKTYRLITPAYDVGGNFVSLHARAVKTTDTGKTRWPRSYEAGGLFMANKLGVMLLKRQPIGEVRGVLICEGMTDLLRASTCALESDLALAVIAGASGSFQHLSKVKFPEGLPIYTATDTDETGARYLALIRKSLKSHQVRPLNLSAT